MKSGEFVLGRPIQLHELATPENYDELSYLAANPDVADALKNGTVISGRNHFDWFGQKEGRYLRKLDDLSGMKKAKLSRIREIIQQDVECKAFSSHLDFLTPELREQFNIIDTDAVSSNNYDADVLALIEKHRDGLILDCGAGSRSIYYQNVVNFEIAVYPSTDVRGVGEVLPFKDNSFDAVVSIAVLEHVKDPWLCASEIQRVLKPGGDLLCCVPFLQPMHGYPHHYYNMTSQGLRNLFERGINIIRHEIPDSVLPIWSLTWMLNSWAAGLEGDALQQFKGMTISELMGDPASYLNMPFVRDLPTEKNFELASATVIHGKKLNAQSGG